MASEPIFFLHNERVCRGHITKRLGGQQHRVKAHGDNYLYADGEVQPIPLDFIRVLRAEEFFRQPDDLLELVAALKGGE
jgi:hypothetical protein